MPDKEFVSSKIRADIKEGENRLLVKSLQKYGRYDYCINICEPETNPDFDGNRIWGLKFKTETTLTGISDSQEQPKVSFKLNNAYPNPFNSSVRIPYQLSNPDRITITVFNIMGQQVRRLLHNKSMSPGEYVVGWDGKDNNGAFLPSGAYLVRLQGVNSGAATKKISFLK